MYYSTSTRLGVTFGIILFGIIFLLILIAPSYQAKGYQQESQKSPLVNDGHKTEDNKGISNEEASDTGRQFPALPIKHFVPGHSLQNEREDKAGQGQTSNENWRRILKNPTSIFTGILAIFTIGLVVVGWFQFAAIRNTAKRQLRAYVFPEIIDIDNVEEPSPNHAPEGPPSITIKTKNSGQTPAYDVTWTGYMSIREYPLGPDGLPLPRRPSEHISKMHIPPGGIVYQTRQMNRPLTAAETFDLRKCKLALYIHGKIAYRDAFNKSRITRYRFFYNGLCAKSGRAPRWLAYKDGNEAN